jgi:hypothetical protein
MRPSSLLVCSLLSGVALAGPAAPAPASGPKALVFCAPGYPGTTQEAQSRMDELASSLAELSGWAKDSLVATYLPQEKAGMARLTQPDAAFALVPLPFFLSHEAELQLTPRLAVVQQGLEATQAWTLVAKRGALKKAADLDGWSVFSTAGYAPDFVSKVALQGFGPLPPGAKVTTGGQVLSALRKASTGADRLAVLLDAEQARSLPTLPFAGELEAVFVGPRLPVAIVATIGTRLAAAELKAATGAFTRLPSSEKGRAALEGVRLTGFAALDEAGLAAAKKAWSAK